MLDVLPENSGVAPNQLAFPANDGARFGTGFTNFQHGLLESGLFTDEKLAELIERYPREFYMITTITGPEDAPEWRNGDLNGVSGQYVLDAVRQGRLWLCLRRFDVVAPEYDRLMDDVFAEAERLNPVLKTFKRKSSLLISSPGARVLYHADIPMVALWHVRGRKRVWLYDANSPKHLPDDVLEGVILRETEEEIPYDTGWDKEAKAVDLEPGWALSWPQNAPHRVDNLDGLNVSITTDFFTAEAQRKYGVYFANGIMRRRFGLRPRSTSVSGLGALAKCAAAVGMKKLGLNKSHERDMIQSFVLDPDVPGKIIELPRSKWTPIVQR